MVYLLFVIAVILFRPGSLLQKTKVTDKSIRSQLILTAFIVVTIAAVTLPMSLAPAWNGERPAWRNQYEVMAERLLEGRIDLYDDVDPRLAEMENPYDPAARKKAGVSTHWDSAYYNGKYYFYFGIVPVLVLFLPFRAIAGVSLTTWIGSAIFASGIVTGLFLLFRLIARRFFPNMTQGLFLLLSTAFSVISVWYVVQAPALYCTAIVSAVAMMVWSFYFYFKTVYEDHSDKKEALYALLGGLFGALAFGCRPPVALANVVAIPLVAAFFRQKKFSAKTIRHAVYALIPYVVVAAGLMIYNYVRFGSPTEFGQAYQITVSDQHLYGNIAERFSLEKEWKGLVENFFGIGKTTTDFPWIKQYSGALINFPILMLSVFIFLPKTVKTAAKEKVFAVMVVLFLAPVIITLIDVLWSPYLLERYRLDVYWLLGITTFFAVGFLHEKLRTDRQKDVFRSVLSVAAFAMIILAVLYFLVPQDASFTQEKPEMLDKLKTMLFFII